MTTETEKPTIDAERALALLEQAMKEKGEGYVYPPDRTDFRAKVCTYERDGEPSCIIGHALHYVGVPVETLREFDTYGETSITGLQRGICGYDDDVEQEPVLPEHVVLTDEALAVFQHAQSAQDNGRTWWEAYEAARDRLEEVRRTVGE